MDSYTTLANCYDSLTGDVSYEEFADYYESQFQRHALPGKLVLDLCCGTGTLTKIMRDRGYEMIGVDASCDMLMAAREKSPDVLFLCQRAENLDLYGTVDGCVCSLDSINYIPRELLSEVLKKVHLFLVPGGVLIFDIRPRTWMEQMDGATCVDETEDLLCLWRADYETDQGILTYGMDLFRRTCGQLWERTSEEHTEYAYDTEQLLESLKLAGFQESFIDDKKDRIFITAIA